MFNVIRVVYVIVTFEISVYIGPFIEEHHVYLKIN